METSITTLEDWVASSKDPELRDKVIENLEAITSCANSLIQTLQTGSTSAQDKDACTQQLILSLQIMRNLCVAGPAVCHRLQALGLIDILSTTLDLIASANVQLNWRLPAIAAQTLANACVSSSDFAAAAWPVFFPRYLLILAHIRSGSAPSVAAFILLTCFRTVETAVHDFLTPAGGEILAALLSGHVHLLKEGASNDTLGLLVTFLCFELGQLESTYICLGSTAAEGDDNTIVNWHQPTTPQVLLLQELAAEAQQIDNATPNIQAPADNEILVATPLTAVENTNTTTKPNSMAFLVRFIELLATGARQSQNQSINISEGAQQVLQDALQLARDIAARDDHGAALCCCSGNENDTIGNSDRLFPVYGLLQANIVELLLAMLKALGPPNPRGSSKNSIIEISDDAVGGGSNTSAINSSDNAYEGLAPSLNERASKLPNKGPYPGYRTDVLSVLANLAHRRPIVQNQVVSLSAEALVLAQCQVDIDSPMAREWGLWAVRNVCEGSEAARKALSELKASEAVDNEELRRAGLQVTLDDATGKVKVVQRE